MGLFPAVLIAALMAAAALGACGSVTSGVGSSSSGAGGAGGDGAGGASLGGASVSGGSGVGGMGTGGECEPYAYRSFPSDNVVGDAGSPPCMFGIPVPPQGSVNADYDVNLRFSSADVEPFIIGRVASESACGPYGWYFDGSSPPTEMLVCPTTCSMFQASNGAIIDLLFGCPTVLAR